MNAIEFTTLLREWRARHGYSDAEAAAARGTGTSIFTRWKTTPYPAS